MKPSRSWLQIVFSLTAAGLVLAAAAVFLDATRFTAYLGSDPQTCNNCHVMDAVYEGWFHAGHRQSAACADCHTPHAFFPKYYVKALSGYHHVSAFITGNIPVHITARPASLEVVQDNCIRCHETAVSAMLAGVPDYDRYCWECHRTVAHGEPGGSLHLYQQPEEVP